MNNAEKIKQQVEMRGIKWLVHFTHIRNVNSILKHGIMPRRETEQLETTLNNALRQSSAREEKFIFPDQCRADEKNASCLSIMFPNNEMLWHKRKQYPDENWVFLLLKPDVLWECDCAFYSTNAASTGLRHKPVADFKTIAAFEAMFASEVKKETTYEIKTITRPEGLKPYLPTDVQAEVLVFNTIAPSYITQCYCHWNLGDMAARAASHYSNIAIFPNAEWVANKIQHIFYGFRDDVDWK